MTARRKIRRATAVAAGAFVLTLAGGGIAAAATSTPAGTGPVDVGGLLPNPVSSAVSGATDGAGNAVDGLTGKLKDQIEDLTGKAGGKTCVKNTQKLDKLVAANPVLKKLDLTSAPLCPALTKTGKKAGDTAKKAGDKVDKTTHKVAKTVKSHHTPTVHKENTTPTHHGTSPKSGHQSDDPSTKPTPTAHHKKKTHHKKSSQHHGKTTTANGPAKPSNLLPAPDGMRFAASGVRIPDFSFPAVSKYAVAGRSAGLAPLIAPEMLQSQAPEHAYLSASAGKAPTVAGLPQTQPTHTSASGRHHTGGAALPVGLVIAAAVGVGAIGAAHIGLLQRKIIRSTE
jgi:hypothetical protein